MEKILKILLLVINRVSIVCVLVFVVWGVYEQIMGPAGGERILEKLNIPWSYDRALITGYVCVAIMIITYLIRAKLVKE